MPKSDIAGEESWPTQPVSTISLVPEKLSPEDAWGKDAQEKQWCTDKIKAARFGEIFTPPSLQGTLVYPSNVGGVNWGSAAFDPQRHLLFVDTNRLPIFVKLIPRDELAEARKNASDLDRLHGEFARQTGAPFAMFRTPLLAHSGLPCNPPPWGTIAAVDLFEGKKVWDVPLGTWIPGMNTGTITLGGPMASAGGLEIRASGWWSGYSDDLLAQRQTVCRDCRWRPWKTWHKARRLRHRLHAAVNGQNLLFGIPTLAPPQTQK